MTVATPWQDNHSVAAFATSLDSDRKEGKHFTDTVIYKNKSEK